MTDYIYIRRCVELVEQKLQWGDSSQWPNSYYQKLSELILDRTHVSISSRTLQRLFGREKSQNEFYNPQIATKNALVLFLGYADWQAFISRTPAVAAPGTEALPAPVAEKPAVKTPEVEKAPLEVAPVQPGQRARAGTAPTARTRPGRSVVLSCCLVSLVAVGLLIHAGLTGKQRPARQPRVHLSGKDLTGYAPHTVHFNYDVSEVEADTVFIGVDGPSVPLDKKKHTFSYFYGLPSLYRTRIIAHNRTLSTLQVLVKSRGWEANLDNNYELSPHVAFEKDKGRLYITPESIKPLVTTKDKIFWTGYRNVQDFDADGDNFTLETRIKSNAEEGGIRCFDTEIEVIGTRANCRITLVEPGCSNFIRLDISDVHKSGRTDDLSSFAQDYSGWGRVKVRVCDKKAEIFFENKLIHRLSYQEPIGAIKGITFWFKGVGSVDYVRLYNAQNQPVYEDDFEKPESAATVSRFAGE